MLQRSSIVVAAAAALAAVVAGEGFSAEIFGTARGLQDSAGNKPLVLGTPVIDSIGTGGFAYYSVDVPLPFSSLYISLTPQYGNSDLYASTALQGRPNRTSAQYGAAGSFGSDGVTIFSTDAFVRQSCLRTARVGSTCQFVVGVYGGETASYILTAALDASVMALPAGIPIAVSVNPNRYVTYAFTPTATVVPNAVAISLAPYAGAVGMYIGSSRLNQTRPRGDVPNSFCGGSWPAPDGSTSSVSYGYLSIDSTSPCWCDTRMGSCVYYIGVGGTDYASFSLVAQQGVSIATQLLDGLGARGMGKAGEYALYDFVFVPAGVSSSGAIATLTMSQVGGEVDAILFVRIHRAGDEGAMMFPTATTAHFTSTVVAGSAAVAIPRDSPIFTDACGGSASTLPCKVHVSIYFPVAAAYTLQARTDSGLQLFDAIPVTGDARVGNPSYFRFQHTAPLSPLVISVTTGTAPVEVYVSNNAQVGMFPPLPGAGKSGWRFVPSTPTTTLAVQTITVFPTDAGACAAPCTYVIGVMPAAGLADVDARVTFSVMARTRDVTTVQLLDGRPTTDVVSSANAVNYYSIVLPPTSGVVVVSLSSPNGAARVFGSFDGQLPAANTASFTTLVDRSVAGSDATFIVSRLDDRVSQWCNQNKTRYVIRTVEQTSIVTEYRVTTEVEVVMRVFYSLETGENVTVPTLVNVTKARPFQVPFKQMVNVTLPEFDITPLWCTLQLGVSADTQGTQYALMAATRLRLLADSLPTPVDVSPGSATYFVYEGAAGAARTTLSITHSIGRAVVYVSTTEMMPNATNAKYILGGFGASSITLDASALGLCDRSAVRCAYYLSVQAQGATGATAQIQGSSFRVTPIEVNEPVAGRVGPSLGGGTPAYYSFVAPVNAKDLEITVEPLSGGWLHVMVGGSRDPVSNVTLQPTAICYAVNATAYSLAGCSAEDLVITDAAYAVQGLASRTRLRVSTADGPARYTPGSTYILAVSSSLDSEFLVTVRTLTTFAQPILLANGVQLHDSLQTADQILYYAVTLPINRLRGPNAVPVRVQVTPVQSDVVVYLGVGSTDVAKRPTAASLTAKAGFPEGYRFTLLPEYLEATCPASGACTVTFGVQASATGAASLPAVFGIVAAIGSADSASMQLTPNVPQLGSASRGAYTYFHVPLAGIAPNTPIFVSLVEVNDGDADVYVSLDGSFPTRTQYGLTSPAYVSPEIVSLMPGTPAYAQAMATGRLAIAVYGQPDSSAEVAEFYIHFGVTGGVTELPDGATVEGTIPAGRYSYFSLTTNKAYTDVEIAVTPLSGSPQLTASTWYTAKSMTYNPFFRPAKEPGTYTWKMNFEGTLYIPGTDPSACSSACTYLFAVFCPGRITCQFEVGATTGMNVPVRTALGVPQMGYLTQGMYRYFVFDGGRAAKSFTVSAQTSTGEVTILVTDSFVPGTTDPSRLPNVDDATTYIAQSLEGTPLVAFNQVDMAAQATVVGSPLRVERIYVVGVYAARGPVAFSLLARQSNSVTALPPGMTSAMIPLEWKQSTAFDYDNQDPTSDLLISVTLLYGSVVLTATTSGAVPVCTVTGARLTGTANCTGAIWMASSVGNSAVLRINAGNPCVGSDNTVVLPGSCVTSRDWKAALVSIVISATDDALFQIVATTGSDAVRAYDGVPIGLSQTQGDRTNVLLFQTSPDNLLSDIHVTLASSSVGASLDYYVVSCIDNLCTDADRLPGPGYNKLTGRMQAGSRQDVIIRSTSPAYCRGAPTDICNYYLVVSPFAHCRSNNIVPCAVRLDATFFSTAGTAPQLVDYATLSQRITTMTSVVRMPDVQGGPTRYSHYTFYVNRPGAPDEDTVDIVVRLDACDSLRGYPAAFLCALTPGPDRVPCSNMRRPRPEDGANNYALITSGTGVDRAYLLSEPSNELYAAVGLQPHPAGRGVASDNAMRKFGPSTYEIQIIDGPAMRMRLPYLGEGVMAAATFVKVSPTVARVSWPQVVTTTDSNPNSDNSTAVGVTYRVYFAPETFTSFASLVTGSNSTELGIVVSTPCGLERWANLVSSQLQPITLVPDGNGGDNTVTLLSNLVPGKRYRVAVVAICDDDCLSANLMNNGFDRPTGPLSTQRLSYGVSTVMVDVDPSPSPSAKPIGGDGHGAIDAGEPISPAMYAGGVLVSLSFMGYMLFVAFRKKSEGGDKLPILQAATGSDAREGALEAVVNAGSNEAVMVTVSPDSHFLSSRSLGRQAGSASSAVVTESPSVSRSAGRAVNDGQNAGTSQAELITLQRISQRVFSSVPTSVGAQAQQ